MNSPLPSVLTPEVMTVLDLLPQAWLAVDRQGAVVAQSPRTADFSLAVLNQVQDSQVLELIAECLDGAEACVREVVLPRTRTHPEQTVRLRMSPLTGGHVLILLEDLTEERRLDAVRRDFVANISHELKTPVGAMSLLAEAITAAKDDPEALARFTERMKRESERLGQLVKDLIELSRLQGHQAPDVSDDIAVDDLVTTALDDVQTLARSKQIEVVVGGTGQLKMRGNFNQLVSALRNLLVNAVNYSPVGARVAVGTRAEDGWLEISVVDQGEGIAKADLDRVFERFYRVDPARSRDTGGTGLGLAIVKHVCASHGGECLVWSHPGDGSTFTMRLPISADERQRA